MHLADRTLHRLLARGERAQLTGNQRLIREPFNDSGSAYWALSLDERDQLHAYLKRAAGTGAVKLTWAKLGGDDRPLEYVVLRDLDELAAFLKVTTAGDALANATNALSTWAHKERVAEILGIWRTLKKIRGLGPESASDFADAHRILDATSLSSEDVLVRPLSVSLFQDSKRIEALFTHLDLLTSESLSSPARHWSEVLSAIGIRKEPQPFLIAGSGVLNLLTGPSVPVARPFVGIATHSLESYRGSPAWVLTVENLTTFHQCAELIGDTDSGLILYTAGMPSPAWLKAYKALLNSLPAATTLFHWGDHDEGGFRIACRLAHACSTHERTLLPWLMSAENGRPATESQHRAMVSSARRTGWLELADALQPLLSEQESVTPALPR